MSDTLLWIALSGGELLLVLFIALFVSWVRNRVMRRRDRKAIEALVSHSRERKDERMAEIGGFLGEKYALEGDAHGYAVRALYKAEARLIQTFARTYLQRDARAASRFHKPIEDGMGEYWSLEPGVGHADFVNAEAAAEQEEAMVRAAAAEAAQEMVDAGELEKLRKENATLSDELRLAMDTMGRMLNEYSNVFAKDADLGNIQVIEGEPTLEDPSEALTDAPLEEEAAAEAAAESMAQATEPSADVTDAADVEEPAETEDGGQQALDEAVAVAEVEAVDVMLAEEAVEEPQPVVADEPETTSAGTSVFEEAEAVLGKADALLREMETGSVEDPAQADADVLPEGQEGEGVEISESRVDDAEIDALLNKLDKES